MTFRSAQNHFVEHINERKYLNNYKSFFTFVN